MPLDIGVGLIAGAIFHHLTGMPLLHAEILAIGFVLLPDLDALIQVIRRGALEYMDSSHRDLLHVPLLYVPIGTAIAWVIVGWEISVLFAVMSLAHFIHDSIGTGWGIPWLRPAYPNYYKFLSEDKGDASVTWRKLIVSWTPEQQRAVAAQYGNPNWLRDMYLKPQKPYLKILIAEILFLVAGVIVLVFVL